MTNPVAKWSQYFVQTVGGATVAPLAAKITRRAYKGVGLWSGEAANTIAKQVVSEGASNMLKDTIEQTMRRCAELEGQKNFYATSGFKPWMHYSWIAKLVAAEVAPFARNKALPAARSAYEYLSPVLTPVVNYAQQNLPGLQAYTYLADAEFVKSVVDSQSFKYVSDKMSTGLANASLLIGKEYAGFTAFDATASLVTCLQMYLGAKLAVGAMIGTYKLAYYSCRYSLEGAYGVASFMADCALAPVRGARDLLWHTVFGVEMPGDDSEMSAENEYFMASLKQDGKMSGDELLKIIAELNARLYILEQKNKMEGIATSLSAADTSTALSGENESAGDGPAREGESPWLQSYRIHRLPPKQRDDNFSSAVELDPKMQLSSI